MSIQALLFCVCMSVSAVEQILHYLTHQGQGITTDNTIAPRLPDQMLSNDQQSES